MSPQVAYLLARIAEDEAVAHAAEAEERSPWRSGDSANRNVYADSGSGAFIIGPWGCDIGETAVHIALWDPARVLAECKAKRRIVEEYVEAAHLSYRLQDEGSDEKWEWMARETALENVVRLHTVPYADRDDFDPTWKD